MTRTIPPPPAAPAHDTVASRAPAGAVPGIDPRGPAGRPADRDAMANHGNRLMAAGGGRLTADRRGIIAIEFALILPLLILLCFGTVEVGRFVLLQMKLDQAVASIADLATRERGLNNDTVDDILTAAAYIVQPFDLDANGRLTLSAVGLAADDQPRILWQRRDQGTLPLPSETGTVGALANLPAEIVLTDGQTVIVAEVSFSFRGMFDLLGERVINKRAYFRPRLGDLRELSAITGRHPPVLADATAAKTPFPVVGASTAAPATPSAGSPAGLSVGSSVGLSIGPFIDNTPAATIRSSATA